MKDLEVLLVTGSNTSETHPVISTFLREAVVKNGAQLIVIDPRRIEMTQFADVYLQIKPGTDVILFQALAHIIVKEETLLTKVFWIPGWKGWKIISPL
jgi:predicted molibdopterin-dependent oxidoreductase YjgC